MIDVVVLGAGPAGSLAARELARRGHRVRLIDKCLFPRSKVCGSTLNGHALATLEAAGLGALASELGAVELQRFELRHSGRTAVVALAHHRALSRNALDLALLESARASGVEVTTGCVGRIVATTSEHVEIELDGANHRETIHAAVAIAADGLCSRALGEPRIATGSRIGAATILERDHDHRAGLLTMAVGRAGYVGLVALEDGRLDIAAALDRDTAKAGVATSIARILHEAGVPCPAGLPKATFQGAPALTRTPSCVARDRVFAVGDAAGYIEPFTGEGIGWALESGLLVAPFASARISGSRGEDRRYTDAHRCSIRKRQRMCRAVAWTLRHSSLLSLAMRAMTASSTIARAVLSHLDAAPHGVTA